MKLTTILVSAILALGVAAVDPEAGSDVEARDFSGESLTEFDTRSEKEKFDILSEEEELDVRDDHDLETRVGDNKCGWGAYEKKGQCYCRNWKHYEYDQGAKKCMKKFRCRGKNVEVVNNYGTKSCRCLREGEVYTKWGCKCKHGEEFSTTFNKCIPDCKHWEKYNPETRKCEKPFRCYGKHVEVIDDNGTKSCKCKLEGQVYGRRGCECKDGEYFSPKYRKCIPKCAYGTKYNGNECTPICKGENVIYKHRQCKCLKPGFYYDESEGCKARCDGDAKYNWRWKKCVCKYGQDYVKGTGCVDKCIKPAYFKKGDCVCPAKDQYYKKGHGCKDRCEAENTHWNGYKCVCDRGTVFRFGKCIELPTCKGQGSYFHKKSWKCVCKAKDEKYEHGKGCVKQCGRNEKLVWQYGGAKCVCKDGYYKTKWGCQKKRGGGY